MSRLHESGGTGQDADPQPVHSPTRVPIHAFEGVLWERVLLVPKPTTMAPRSWDRVDGTRGRK